MYIKRHLLSTCCLWSKIYKAKTKHSPQQFHCEKRFATEDLGMISPQFTARRASSNLTCLTFWTLTKATYPQNSHPALPPPLLFFLFYIIHFNCLFRNLGFGFCKNTTPKLLPLGEWHGFTSGWQKQFLVCEKERQPKQLLSCVVLFQPVKRMQKISSRKASGARRRGRLTSGLLSMLVRFSAGDIKDTPKALVAVLSSTFNSVKVTCWCEMMEEKKRRRPASKNTCQLLELKVCEFMMSPPFPDQQRQWNCRGTEFFFLTPSPPLKANMWPADEKFLLRN